MLEGGVVLVGGEVLEGGAGLAGGAVDEPPLGTDGLLVPGAEGSPPLGFDGWLGAGAGEEGFVPEGVGTSEFSHVPGMSAMGRSHVAVRVTPFPMSNPLMAVHDQATNPPI